MFYNRANTNNVGSQCAPAKYGSHRITRRSQSRRILELSDWASLRGSGGVVTLRGKIGERTCPLRKLALKTWHEVDDTVDGFSHVALVSRACETRVIH